MSSIATPASSPPSASEPRVPFVRLDQGDPELITELLEVTERVARSGAFTLGEELATFERAFAAWCDCPDAIGVSSGTSALELALRALGIGPGDEVIVPTNSFIATAEAVTAAGATPRLVDVDERTALLTAEIVEEAIGPRTRCRNPRAPLRAHRGHGSAARALPVARPRCGRGCLPGARRALPRQAGRVARRRRLLQLLPDQEPRRLGRRRGDRHRRRRARRAPASDALPRRGGATPSSPRLPAPHRLHSLQAAILAVKLRRLDGWNDQRRAAARYLSAALADSGLTLPAGGRPGVRPRLPPLRRARLRPRRPAPSPRGARRGQRSPLPDPDSPAAGLRRCRARPRAPCRSVSAWRGKAARCRSSPRSPPPSWTASPRRWRAFLPTTANAAGGRSTPTPA